MPHPSAVIRIVLIGTQRVVLDSLVSLIVNEPDLKVLIEGDTHDSMVATREQPDIALFDLDEADDDGVFERLAKTAAATRTIALSISVDPVMSLRVFQSGAKGLVSKRQPPEHLLMAIRKVHAGEAWLGRSMAAQVLELARADRQNKRRTATSGEPALTARDRQLIALVGEGWRNADIARHIVASEATVRASLSSIFRKLNVPGRFALMLYASQHGYVNLSHRPRQQALLR